MSVGERRAALASAQHTHSQRRMLCIAALKIVHVVGARPNFMKIAPIMQVMAARTQRFEQALVHTGQHYDPTLSSVFFDELGLPRPDVNLEVGSGSHAWQTAQVMLRLEPVVRAESPDWVVVVGDVNSTLAAALVCCKLGIRVAHVEAGLRSHDRSMPEEHNRVLTDHISDVLFTPSADANQNLRQEAIPQERIRFVGNVMIDTLVRHLPAIKAHWKRWTTQLAREQYVVVTLHRPANVDDRPTLSSILSTLMEIAGDVPVVFPIHPRTRAHIAAILGNAAPPTGLHLLDPQGYLDFMALLLNATAVVTDSGGVQEETTYLGVPCLTVRPNTERPITVTMGTNRLVPRLADLPGAIAAARLHGRGSRSEPPPLWDGHAAERIAVALESL